MLVFFKKWNMQIEGFKNEH